MAKINLTDISAGYISLTTFNANNTLIEAAFENTMSRDGTSPNAMSANLDMNSFRINNLSTAVNNSEPVTLGQANILAGVTNALTRSSIISKLFAAPDTLGNNATPTVSGGYSYITGGTTTITDFDDGAVGQVIVILSQHAITITDGTNIILHGSANFVMASADSLTLLLKADNKWYELSRMVN